MCASLSRVFFGARVENSSGKFLCRHASERRDARPPQLKNTWGEAIVANDDSNTVLGLFKYDLHLRLHGCRSDIAGQFMRCGSSEGMKCGRGAAQFS